MPHTPVTTDPLAKKEGLLPQNFRHLCPPLYLLLLGAMISILKREVGRGLLLELSLPVLMSAPWFQAMLTPGHATIQGKNGQLTASLVVLQILVFPNSSATIYFSESSNSCSLHSVHVL